jgi:hypothetical protein
MDWSLENPWRRQSPPQLPPLQLPPLQLRPLQLRPFQLRPLELRPLQLRPLQLRPLKLRPLKLRPLQLRNVPDVPRLNVAPPRAGIDLMCAPPRPPPPRRGSAFAPDAANVTAAKQLKKSISFAFIGCLSVYVLYTPKREASQIFRLPLKIRGQLRQPR